MSLNTIANKHIVVVRQSRSLSIMGPHSGGLDLRKKVWDRKKAFQLISSRLPAATMVGNQLSMATCRFYIMASPATPRFSSSALPFFGEGSPTKIDYGHRWYPYSNLSTGEPRASTSLLRFGSGWGEIGCFP